MSDRDSSRTATSELSCSPSPDINRSTICCWRASSSSIRAPCRYSWRVLDAAARGILHLAIERGQQGLGLLEVPRRRRSMTTVQSRAPGRPDKTRPGTSRCAGARFRATVPPGRDRRTYGPSAPARSWTGLPGSRPGPRSASGRPHRDRRREGPRGSPPGTIHHRARAVIGVAPALEKLEPLCPMRRDLLPDRFERDLRLALASTQSDATRSIRPSRLSDFARRSSRTFCIPSGSATIFAPAWATAAVRAIELARVGLGGQVKLGKRIEPCRKLGPRGARSPRDTARAAAVRWSSRSTVLAISCAWFSISWNDPFSLISFSASASGALENMRARLLGQFSVPCRGRP